MPSYDAIIVGSGPNGLAAAITLAQAGKSVVVYEANETIGGGCTSAELTLTGFVHDPCSTVHPFGVGSPFFRPLPLDRYGLGWIYPDAAVAHPFDDGTAAILERSIEATAARLGRDGGAYRFLVKPHVDHWDKLAPMILGPLIRFPRHPFVLARFGIPALLPARWLAKILFRERDARALFGGLAAHSMLSLDTLVSASFGMVLGITAHALGWAIPRGGSQKISNALAAHFRSLGGEIITQTRVTSLDMLPRHRAVMFDVTPRQMENIAGDRFSGLYRRQLTRFRYGPGVFKVDWALDAPIPWAARECSRASTVHLGGELDEIAAGEAAVARGHIPSQPYVLLTQPTLFDPSRAPAGKHIAWAYCHVPNGSTVDMTERIEAQVERFAPGFRQRILARCVKSPAQLEKRNANYVGGDINGGIEDVWQTFARPVLRLNPYTTSDRDLYLCSSSTPPGGGVHGMCGYHAANVMLHRDKLNKK